VLLLRTEEILKLEKPERHRLMQHFLFRETVARHEPKAIVTIKSKAFIFDNVRLPDKRKKNIRHI
jgi:hypothetical protein